jgi:hypothetical protein
MEEFWEQDLEKKFNYFSNKGLWSENIQKFSQTYPEYCEPSLLHCWPLLDLEAIQYESELDLELLQYESELRGKSSRMLL